MPDRYDVIVYGLVCLDTIWRVERLPMPGGYAQVLAERRTIGGEAANTAIALARWGVRVALVGYALGEDEDGRLLRALFAFGWGLVLVATFRSVLVLGVAGFAIMLGTLLAIDREVRTMGRVGLDSLIEIFASIVVVWQLTGVNLHRECSLWLVVGRSARLPGHCLLRHS